MDDFLFKLKQLKSGLASLLGRCMSEQAASDGIGR